ncbi:hypothetical protein ACFOZ7_05770 [Natribaculum luteum]|uniref:Uncharacterized protein n=1 Tax=Natribaculum luteum TaxID=1586232 RepID=A0ABD5NXU4_9EURY|nr:hypothetical protein [Natribaculum luteum]
MSDSSDDATPYYEPLVDAEQLVGEWLAPACPRCGDPVMWVHSRGPDDHRASPCGCRLGAVEAREL